MADPAYTSAALSPGERFQPLRRELGIVSFGINLLTLEPGQRGRVHAHDRQEEVYVVLEGELTLIIEGEPTDFGPGTAIRVGPAVRRQLVDRGPERVVVLALGGSGEHVGRDGRAWSSWEEGGPGRSPQEVPLPGDV